MVKQNRLDNPNIPKCTWQTFAKKIKPYLLEQSNNHCSYCDIYFENRNASEVEHFKPRNQFPELEFNWENLFASCSPCNKQKEQDYKKYKNIHLPIQPDEPDYNFFKYFEMNFSTCEININDNLTINERKQAREYN